MPDSLRPLKLFPAIDLIEGRCVRLSQGKFSNISTYSVDPLETAKSFEKSGAEALHIVDLDGARAQYPVQREIIEKIASETKLDIQVGGGIRKPNQALAYLGAGARRIVIGSLAVLDPLATARIIDEVGEDRVTLAFDFLRDEQGAIWPAVDAWARSVQLSPVSLFAQYRRWPRLQYLCTDISRDGCMQGIDRQFYSALIKVSEGAMIQASGGVAALDDIRTARELRLHGAVIGRALYEGAFSLEEALKC